MKILVIGVSSASPCGVKEYADVLSAGLCNRGHEVHDRWLHWSDGRLPRGLECIRPEEDDFDLVLWHYSVFSYGRSGLPTLARKFARALHHEPAPIVTVLHEHAYPWRQGGWKGAAWAAAHRLALRSVVQVSSGLVMTVEDRSAWLAGRAWLSHRPTLVQPVFPTIGFGLPDLAQAPRDRERVGMFGYPAAVAPLVLEAMSKVIQSAPAAELLLIGAPGPDSEVGRTWQRFAATLGIGEALRFTGVAPPPELRAALSSCDALIFDDGGGPSPRKTTLAGMLASGRPVLAVDGPHTWSQLIESGAVRLVDRDSSTLACAVREVLEDEAGRERLGQRGREFVVRVQSPDVIVGEIGAFLEHLHDDRSP